MTGRTWLPVTEERSVRSSPAWFQVIDDVTGRPPMSPVRVSLEVLDGATWRPVDGAVAITAGGALVFPRLERRRLVAGVPARRYRVRVSSEWYRPLYRRLAMGVEFQTLPDSDETLPPGAPPPVTPQRIDLVLLPSVTYPYGTHVRTLRGQVVDGTDGGRPVEDVMVSCRTVIGGQPRLERTLTDARGAFALALRWVAIGGTATVIALDERTRLTSTVNIAVPEDLRHSQLITIT